MLQEEEFCGSELGSEKQHVLGLECLNLSEVQKEVVVSLLIFSCLQKEAVVGRRQAGLFFLHRSVYTSINSKDVILYMLYLYVSIRSVRNRFYVNMHVYVFIYIYRKPVNFMWCFVRIRLLQCTALRVQQETQRATLLSVFE